MSRRGKKARPGVAMLAGAALLLALVLAYAGALNWGRSPAPTIGGAFTLQSSDGRTVTDRDFRGKYLLIYFGYTTCKDVCPITLAALGDAMTRLGRTADQVQPVFITVDPAHDTPAVMRAYVRQFSPRLEGLTGTAAQIDAVTANYHVMRIRHGTTIDHSSVIYVIGPEGNYLSPIPADAPPSAMAVLVAQAVMHAEAP
jgi:protein SCO1/2